MVYLFEEGMISSIGGKFGRGHTSQPTTTMEFKSTIHLPILMPESNLEQGALMGDCKTSTMSLASSRSTGGMKATGVVNHLCRDLDRTLVMLPCHVVYSSATVQWECPSDKYQCLYMKCELRTTLQLEASLNCLTCDKNS